LWKYMTLVGKSLRVVNINTEWLIFKNQWFSGFSSAYENLVSFSRNNALVNF
jgi:hypothetical protein